MTTIAATRRTMITILVDNEAGAGLEAEHGLALWIQTDDWNCLFDTGQGDALGRNARILGIDPHSAHSLVLSHGHYDHSGGLAALLPSCRHLDVYCHPAVANPRYAIRDLQVKPLQMPRSAMAVLDRHPQEHLHWVQRPVMLTETVGLTGPIVRETIFEDTGGPFFLDRTGQRPDPVDDDLALWIRTEQGVIVCVGCAHAGLVNTLQQVRRLSHDLHIHAVIGGFHLLNADRRRLEQTIAALRRLDPEMIVPCHCTGAAAVDELRRAFGRRCRPGMAGMLCRFDTPPPMPPEKSQRSSPLPST